MGQSVLRISLLIQVISRKWEKKWCQGWRMNGKTYLLKANRGIRALTNQKAWQKILSGTKTRNLTHVYSHSTVQPLTRAISLPKDLNLSSRGSPHKYLIQTGTNSMATLLMRKTSSRSPWTQLKAWNQLNTLGTRVNIIWARLIGMTLTRKNPLKYVQCWHCRNTRLRSATQVSMFRLIRGQVCGRLNDSKIYICFDLSLFMPYYLCRETKKCI